VAARCYQRGWAAASLRVMLASSLLMKRSRPQIPGKDKLSSSGKDDRFYEDLEATGFQTCPIDGGEIVRGEDGSLYCQICALPVEDMPDALGK
jgi:hypothetical protein